MKRITVLTLISLTLISGQAYADECTGQINAYIAGLKTGIQNTYTSNVNKEVGTNEIKRISSLRNNASDCDVVMKIPSLANAKAASEQAIQAIKKQ